jgi:hypothetical protein
MGALPYFRAARRGPRRAVLCDTVQVVQFCRRNFVDYYLLTIPDKSGIISMSRGDSE